MFIDDNPHTIKEKLKILKTWFHPASKFYLMDEPTPVDLHKKTQWNKLFQNDIAGIINTPIDIVDINGKSEKNFCISNENKISFDFIVIDIDYDGQSIGFELLYKLKNELNETESKASLIVFSRYGSPSIIQSALNSGALFYITKGNFLQFVPKITQLKFVFSENQHKYLKYENWRSLDKLPPVKVAELKSTIITGIEQYNPNKLNHWNENLEYTENYIFSRTGTIGFQEGIIIERQDSLYN